MRGARRHRPQSMVTGGDGQGARHAPAQSPLAVFQRSGCGRVNSSLHRTHRFVHHRSNVPVLRIWVSFIITDASSICYTLAMISKHGTGIALGLIIISGSMALSQALGESRIINGQVADMATYPFLVSIRKYENGDVSQCGGSVLTPRVVLTAAHCVAPREDTGEPEGTPYNAINNFYLPLVVTAADVPVGDPHSGNIPATSLVPTKAVVTSAGWNGAAQGGYDLALLLLEDDLVDVETVTLPAAGTTYTVGEAFNLAGWGTY